jgi:hypothetical protein
MNKTNKTVVIIVVLAILIGGGLILFIPNKSEAPSGKNTNSNSVDHADSTTDTNVNPTVTITYDGSSFSSSGTSIKSGESIKVVNSSNNELEFDSDPHPVHTDNHELNEGGIAPGESRIFNLTTKGTWGYHNHLNASQKGEITVE